MKKHFMILSCGVVMMLMPACSDNNELSSGGEEPMQPRVEISLTRSQKEIVDSEVRFSFDFLSALNRECLQVNDNSNYAVSPLSMQRDLSILANGASGNTLEEIKGILHLAADKSISDLNNLNATLLDGLLAADSWVKLLFSSSAWYDNKFKVNDSFVNLINGSYGTPSTYVDFGSDAAKEVINGWVKENTKGEIDRLIREDESTANIRFMLLDALYFKGRWADMFDKKNTSYGTFFNHGTDAVDVAIMNASIPAGVCQDESCTFMSLDFGNRSFSMNIIMANDGYDINDVIAELDYSKWQIMKSGMGMRELEVSLPKFKVEKEIVLTPVMERLGLTVSFPDLSLMSDDTVDLLRMRQNTVIEIEERGAVASTVTEVSGMDSAYNPTTDEIRIDRPFVFFIEEHSTGAILFMGKISEL